MRLKKATRTMLLPQYMHSGNVTERWLSAMNENIEIKRESSIPNTIKLTSAEELSRESLRYFIDNKKSMEDEFYEDLCQSISSGKADEFIRTISNDWADGRSLRNSSSVKKLRESIRNYFNEKRVWKTPKPALVRNWKSGQVPPSLEPEEVGEVIRTTKQLLYKHIHAWIDTHEDSRSLTLSRIFLKRGLCLSRRMRGGSYYREWDYINSYSFSLSIPEQFSEAGQGNVRAIISADYEYFDGRILFFSPFIRNMSPMQLEVGIIPSFKPQMLISQGRHGGIYEYLVEHV